MGYNRVPGFHQFFISWSSTNGQMDNVILCADGARKIQWLSGERRKRDGVWVIYFNLTADKVVLLAAVYANRKGKNPPRRCIWHQ